MQEVVALAVQDHATTDAILHVTMHVAITANHPVYMVLNNDNTVNRSLR